MWVVILIYVTNFDCFVNRTMHNTRENEVTMTVIHRHTVMTSVVITSGVEAK